MMEVNNFELWARSVSGEAEKFDAGQTIFTKGQSGKHMYIVRSGTVDILIDDRIVETVEANGIFGEMAVVDGSDRSGTARARTACELAPIDQRTFILMVDEAPYFALNVMRLMVHRLRRAGN
jgi:CRP/FNR family cyclic AMP-dependent transcriptional regulator